jgi:hypothetical protein
MMSEELLSEGHGDIPMVLPSGLNSLVSALAQRIRYSPDRMLSAGKVAVETGSEYFQFISFIVWLELLNSSINSTEGKSICGDGSANISLITRSPFFARKGLMYEKLPVFTAIRFPALSLMPVTVS